jgi:hypothetical protein
MNSFLCLLVVGLFCFSVAYGKDFKLTVKFDRNVEAGHTVQVYFKASNSVDGSTTELAEAPVSPGHNSATMTVTLPENTVSELLFGKTIYYFDAKCTSSSNEDCSKNYEITEEKFERLLP